MGDDTKVGGEIEAYCTTCKIMKWHVVVAVVEDKPVKVECHGCHKQHNFRSGPPGTRKPSSPRAPRAAVSSPSPLSPSELETKIASGEATARPYSPRTRFVVEECVRHPTFGCGLVVSLPGMQKMEVAFRSGRKLLVHERTDEAPPPTLARPAPLDFAARPMVSDAPPEKDKPT